VGGAMAACPDDVPWQRVIHSQGKVSERAGAQKQRQLLEAEGILFDAKDRMDLKKYGWSGKDEEDIPQQPLDPTDYFASSIINVSRAKSKVIWLVLTLSSITSR
jgi:methylated-DNA-protein-cysteine methyltransferase-like protein